MYEKQDMDDWAEKSIPILKRYGYLKQQGKTQWLLPITLFIIGVFIGGILIYGINKGSFKTELNQQIEPNISVNTENQYEFNPQTENQYDFKPNYSINNYNNIIIPDNLCGGGS